MTSIIHICRSVAAHILVHSIANKSYLLKILCILLNIKNGKGVFYGNYGA